MTNPAAKHRRPRGYIAAAIVCGMAGLVLFHCFGNATRGYIPSASLFYWWGFQWLNPGSETEHGWLIPGLALWVWWRNLAIADRGSRIAEEAEAGSGKLETGVRSPDTGGGRGESGSWKPETGNWNVPAGNRAPEFRERTEEAAHSALESGNESRTSSSPVSGLRFPDSSVPRSAFRDPQSLAAPAAMIAGLALHALGFAAQQTRVSIVAFLIFTWGVARLGGGRRWGDAAVFPLAFMVFAIPISALDEIGLPLRLWVTRAGEWMAHLAGIEVVRSGTQLVAPDGRFNYDVAAPCSGVRSLMALAALSVLIGYLNFRSWWRRVFVFGFSLPLVYAGNVARIVVIIFAAHAGGEAWGNRAHSIMGYGVFVIVLGGVLAAVALMRRWPEGGRDRRREGDRSPETGDRRREAGDRKRETGNRRGEDGVSGLRLPGVSAAAAVLFLIGLEMLFLHRLAQMPPRGQVGVMLADDGLNPVELPAFLGTEWIGQRAPVSDVEREILPPDTGFSRKNYAFVGDRTRDVFLSIVLSGRDRTSIHRPELCLVGQGWTIEGVARQTFQAGAAGEADGGEFQATVLRVRREVVSPRGRVVVPQLVAYWFVAGDTIVASHWGRFVRDAWNRVARARADRWAYVLLQTDARDGEAAALARMQAVLDETLPVFQKVGSAKGHR